jgi:three-Cys-motif partner protein
MTERIEPDQDVQDGRPHEFGGQWTLEKLRALKKYLAAFTTALKEKPSPHRPFRLMYIDAFAGSGTIQLGINGRRIAGSAKIALRTDPPFHELVFIERDSDRCAQLHTIARTDRRVRVVHGDANEELQRTCAMMDWGSTKGRAFPRSVRDECALGHPLRGGSN